MKSIPGVELIELPDGNVCCGSAGTYNLLQPKLASRLRDRKVENIARVRPDLIATGNIGCITQIAQGTEIPILHTVELLDQAMLQDDAVSEVWASLGQLRLQSAVVRFESASRFGIN